MREGIRMIAFTAAGAELAVRLAAALEDCSVWAPPKYLREGQRPLDTPIGDWAAEWFERSRALVFLGAAGIAIRAVAPLLTGKDRDPAVLCMDQEGRYAIPLLSGHLGGANRLAEKLAVITGGIPVITTATDVQGVFSPDAWAARSGCAVPRPEQIKAVSAALLDGEGVGFYSDFPIEGLLPPGVSEGQDSPCGIELSLEFRQRFARSLWLAPKCLRLGVGCRKGISAGVLEARILETLEQHSLPLEAVEAVASITLKQEEAGILTFCEKHRIPAVFYEPERLEQVAGSVSPSPFVRSVTGVDNVCERAALAEGGTLTVEKSSGCGVTVAVAKRNWRAVF